MRAAVLAWLAVALVASGCTVEPPRVDGSLPHAQGPRGGNATLPAGPEAAGNLSLEAPPSWQHGQWWRFRAHSADGSFDVRDTRVATTDLGTAWRVDTDQPRVAYFDAASDISTVGPIRKADLAGQQAAGPVEFYHWPLVVNNTWTMTLDGAPYGVTVTEIANRTVAGKPATVATLEARQGLQLAARYTYVAEVGWFSTMQFLRPDGSPRFSIDLEAWGQDYKGDVVRVAATPRYHDAGANLQPQGSFDVAQGATFLDVALAITGDQVNGAVNLLPPDNSAPVTINVGPCTSNCSVNFGSQFNATPGTWRIVAATVVQGSTTPAHAQVDVVAATVERIAVA